jgi:predicted cupin superfamily sugar epimerase
MIAHTAAQLIHSLGLLRHPEGGWYRETYRSTGTIPVAALPEGFNGSRPVCTAIYFLLEQGDISALHRIKSDEMWHFYSGAGLTVHVLTEAGDYSTIRLGSACGAGEQFQAVVPAGAWFGAEVTGGAYALVGCTVAPGFDFADFVMAEREDMLHRYPHHAALIERLTR